jgi:hypothetical protein
MRGGNSDVVSGSEEEQEEDDDTTPSSALRWWDFLGRDDDDGFAETEPVGDAVAAMVAVVIADDEDDGFGRETRPLVGSMMLSFGRRIENMTDSGYFVGFCDGIQETNEMLHFGIVRSTFVSF